MKIEKQQKEDLVVYKLDGRLDGLTALNLEEIFVSQFDSKAKEYIIDMASLEYISSAGLRAIITCRNRAKKDDIKFNICNLAKTVNKVFDIAGFSSILDLNLSFKNGSIFK